MATRTERQSHQFPDGSRIEWTIRTDDGNVYRIFTNEVARRVAAAQRLLGRGLSPTSVNAVPGAGRHDTSQSERTLSLPDGEVTVTVDAGGSAAHAYLLSLVRAAVAYTHSCHVDAGRAGALAAGLFAVGLGLVALGHGVPSVPVFGAGLVVALHVAVYALSARGLLPSLTLIPDPTDAGA